MNDPRLRVAIGPVMKGFGSWEWVGHEMAVELRATFEVVEFSNELPEADVIVFVKFPPIQTQWPQIAMTTAKIIYCPVDFYGSAAEIEAAGPFLHQCNRVVVHSQRLARYFQRFSQVEYLDHHVRFFNEELAECTADGPILWTGVRTHLPTLAEWVNQFSLPKDLLVLTNFEQCEDDVSAEKFGFSHRNTVTVSRWSEATHRQAIREASLAIDIRGNDFRERHKPPTKAMDALSAGLPLAMNQSAVAVDYLESLGFRCVRLPEVFSSESADGLQTSFERWMSFEYRTETQQFGQAVRELLSRRRIGIRLERIIRQAAAV